MSVITGPTRRIPRRTLGSYTTCRDTILEGFDAANALVKPIERRDTPIEDVRASFDRNQGKFRPGP